MNSGLCPANGMGLQKRDSDVRRAENAFFAVSRFNDASHCVTRKVRFEACTNRAALFRIWLTWKRSLNHWGSARFYHRSGTDTLDRKNLEPMNTASSMTTRWKGFATCSTADLSHSVSRWLVHTR